jgi:phytoene dehydrogenase-like protein
MRELRRWSRTDAEAYEEYGRLMVDMARFIKPVLSIVPPDPGRIDPRDWLGVLGLARSFRDLSEYHQSVFVQLMTMSAAEFLEQWFETDPLIATMSASGIIGTLRDEKTRPIGREGTAASHWVLVDFGSVVVHIFTPPERDYYGLEKHWSEARTILSVQ